MNADWNRSRWMRAGFLALTISLTTLRAAPLLPAEGLTINVKQSGAIGDGVADDTAAIQGALNGGKRAVVIPSGTYKISAALKVDSDTTIRADAQAVIRLADHAGNGVGLFLLANRDFIAGNSNINVEGGIWDGNNEHNIRGLKEQMPCYTGVAINFINVRGLALRNLTVRNPDAYAIRACHLEDFVIENIGFDFSVTRPNQDGVHLDGFCQRGVIRNLRALSPYATNDDMVALNADDGAAGDYVIQQGMVPGPIRDITVEHLRADSAFTFVRLLSHREVIENITISDVVGGCRYYAINMDRWRFPAGGGNIHNVTLRDFTIRKTPDDFNRQKAAGQRPLIHIQTAVRGLRIENFRRTEGNETTASTLVLDNGQQNQVLLKGLTAAQAAELAKLSPTVTAAMLVAAPGGSEETGRALEMDAPGKITLPTGGFSFLKLDAKNPATVTAVGSAQVQDTGQPKTSTIEIGDARQLFLDDRLLDLAQSRNVTRTLNPPHSIQRVLKPDQPWEALGFIFYCSVVDDGGTMKLFHGSYDSEKKKHFMLATSTDGFHWERPQLGLKAFRESKANNLLPLDAVEASVFLDPHAPAEKRYRLILTHGWPDPARGGVYVASSPDGIHWTIGAERVLPFVPDNQPSAVWDERLQKYVVYLRAWNPDRVIARVEVADLDAPWPYDASVPPLMVWGKDKIPTLSRELPTVMACDAQDPKYLQLYTSSVVRYPFAPDVYMAFPAAFQLYKGPEWESRMVTTADGPFDALFASSRDGITWNRWRQPYVATGFCEDLNLQLVSMGMGMVRRGPWIHQYFVGWPYTHGQPTAWDRHPEGRSKWMGKDLGGIYCATQRMDGFVSMNADNAGGTLTTQPLVFKGDRLRINIHTAGSGSAKVALLGADGSLLTGFSAGDCEIISADAMDHEVRWKAGADIGALAGKPLRVQWTMRNAKLYALQFGMAQK